MKRDFTYIADIVEGIFRIIDRPATADQQWNGKKPDSATSSAPYRLFNIGNHSSIELLRFIEVVEHCLEKKATIRLLPAQPGDVLVTSADVSDFTLHTGFEPQTALETGMRAFTDWYRAYYGK
jgi:UDP-glucuronate 4-epimerase